MWPWNQASNNFSIMGMCACVYDMTKYSHAFADACGWSSFIFANTNPMGCYRKFQQVCLNYDRQHLIRVWFIHSFMRIKSIMAVNDAIQINEFVEWFNCFNQVRWNSASDYSYSVHYITHISRMKITLKCTIKIVSFLFGDSKLEWMHSGHNEIILNLIRNDYCWEWRYHSKYLTSFHMWTVWI